MKLKTYAISKTVLLCMSITPLFGGLVITEDQGDGSSWIHSDPEINTAGSNNPDYFTSGIGVGNTSGDSVSQTFKPTTTFQLDYIDLAYANASAGTVGVRIQEATVALNGGSTAYEYSLGPDLLSGVTFGLTVDNTDINVLTLDFTGADEITLNANTTYAIEFVNTGASDGSFGLRRRGGSYYADGMVFSNRVSVNGTATRDAGMQIYAVPEPGTLTLASVALLMFSILHFRKR